MSRLNWTHLKKISIGIFFLVHIFIFRVISKFRPFRINLMCFCLLLLNQHEIYYFKFDTYDVWSRFEFVDYFFCSIVDFLANLLMKCKYFLNTHTRIMWNLCTKKHTQFVIKKNLQFLAFNKFRMQICCIYCVCEYCHVAVSLCALCMFEQKTELFTGEYSKFFFL